jgi:hypothetical protein
LIFTIKTVRFIVNASFLARRKKPALDDPLPSCIGFVEFHTLPLLLKIRRFQKTSTAIPISAAFSSRMKFDELLKSRFSDGFLKRPKFKAREFRVVRCSWPTPQRQRDEAQRRNWTFYKAIKFE